MFELNIMKDHVHMVAKIPQRMSISYAMGIIKGKTAIMLFKGHTNFKQKLYWGNHFWSRGYCVTTIGADEDKIRRYVKYQEDREKQEENSSRIIGSLRVQILKATTFGGDCLLGIIS